MEMIKKYKPVEELTLNDLNGLKVIGLRRLFKIDSTPGEGMFDEEYVTDHEYYELFLRDDFRRNIKIELDWWYGWCGSGYTTADGAWYSISQVGKIGPLTHLPKDKNLRLDVEITEKPNREYASTNIFQVKNFGDEYYPAGTLDVNLDLFDELPRAMQSKPTWIFVGESGLGKSTLGTILMNADLWVYETDKDEELPNEILADVVVIGNKYDHTLDDVKDRLKDKSNIIVCDFRKAEVENNENR